MPPVTDGLPQALPPLPKALHAVARAYAGALAWRGTTAAGVGWSSAQVQEVRFSVLLRLLDPLAAVGPLTVQDLGCGYGALWPHLAHRRTPPIASYTGYDIAPEMISAARLLHADEPRARFLLGCRPDEVADCGFVSGTFNYRGVEATPEDWAALIEAGLSDLAACCRLGMAFNLLHQRQNRRLPAMHYSNPERVLAFAETLAAARGGRVQVIDDYLEEDFTVLVWFSHPPAAVRDAETTPEYDRPGE